MAAGTAAALVPIRSITRYSDGKTTEFIKADSEDPGPVCDKLLTTLKGIQQGLIKDTFGWCSAVTEVDSSKYGPSEGTHDVDVSNVDKLP